ncbi:hypothetical protein F2Q69_00027709 [Brassica cretica]|uniref:Uncharacterized protein n=4 Tax=Brassica cretica TaxID=69181 RepID=A0A8S9RSI3_BRACR|nr:hypothetical protein F2Q69_00027709 [Brassica cretica]KAF3609996.1 hypothetical protein DY000_02046766 [Brassica cretica]
MSPYPPQFLPVEVLYRGVGSPGQRKVHRLRRVNVDAPQNYRWKANSILLSRRMDLSSPRLRAETATPPSTIWIWRKYPWPSLLKLMAAEEARNEAIGGGGRTVLESRVVAVVILLDLLQVLPSLRINPLLEDIMAKEMLAFPR